ncbi:MAG: rhomboid family intramembrane serine protease [Treponema sp.]|nr:rhomboid family intramembrane serine protease [Treponema sp.]
MLMHFVGNTVIGTVDISDLEISDFFGRRYTKMEMTVSSTLAMMPQAVVKNSAFWTFITYMFMHGGVSHILFNMFGLFIFGLHVERQIGSKEFLLYYLITGIMAGIFSFGVYYLSGNYIAALVGASGALYAVMLAYAVFFPDAIVYIWGILPLRAPIMVLGFTALELVFSITRTNSGVAHLTHLAGFGFGWLYFMIRFGVNPLRRLMGRYR